MKEAKPIEINLELLGQTISLQENELIYRDQIKEMQKKIIEHTRVNVKEMEKYGKTSIMHHPCFFINGGRGSGKSTVLRALRSSLDNCVSPDGHKIKLLADLDPTELADTENFFVHILGRVQKQLQKYNRFILDGEKQNKIKQAYNCIKVMSRGLSLLTRRDANAERIDDADFFIQESVLECVSSTRLKEKFAELMDCLSSLTEVSVWLVTVDDADMNFNKCSEVFETIRKYLLNPRMVFIFAGDLKLYTMVVRGMQMGHFGHTSLKYDESRKLHIYELMDNLEEQYIMKLFPAESRMNLSYFGEIIEMEPLIKYGKEVNEISMKKYLSEELKQCHVNYDGAQVIDFMSGLSTRSALQLIAYWVKHIKRAGAGESDKEVRRRNMRYWCNGIQFISSHALTKHRIFSDALRGRGRKGIIKSLFIFGKNMEIGARGARLFSDNSEESIQKVAFYLSAEVVRQIQSVSDIIFYTFSLFPYLHRYGKDVTLTERHLNHLNGNTARQLGEDCSNAVLALKEKKDYFFNGVIPLNNSEHVSRNQNICRTSADDFFKKIVDIVKKEKTKENIIYFIVLYHSLCLCKVEEKNKFCLSIFNFLFVIQSLLDLRADDEALSDKVRCILLDRKMGLGTGNVKIENKAGNSLNVEKNENVNNKLLIEFLDELEEDNNFKAVVEDIVKWKKNSSGETNDTYLCTAESLYECWDDFWDQCNYITETSKIESYDSRDLVDAWTLFNSYLKAFRKSMKTYLGVDNSSLLDSCDLWMCLQKAEWTNSELCKALEEVNIAPIDIWLNVEKFKKFIEARLVTLKSEVGERMTRMLENIVKKSMERFTNWCSIRIYKLEQNVPDERKESMYERQGGDEELFKRKLEIIKTAIGARKTTLAGLHTEIRKRYFMAVSSIFDEQAQIVKGKLFEELKKINREEIAQRRTVQLLRDFGRSRLPYRDAIESPMEDEVYEEEIKAQHDIDNLLKDMTD